MSKQALEPSQVTYQEKYKVDCPHGCHTKVTVTVTRVKGGIGLTEIKVEHEDK